MKGDDVPVGDERWLVSFRYQAEFHHDGRWFTSPGPVDDFVILDDHPAKWAANMKLQYAAWRQNPSKDRGDNLLRIYSATAVPAKTMNRREYEALR